MLQDPFVDEGDTDWQLFGESYNDDGDSHDDVFLVMLGAGMDADMIAGTDDRLKARVGWLAYVGAFASTLLRGRPGDSQGNPGAGSGSLEIHNVNAVGCQCGCGCFPGLGTMSQVVFCLGLIPIEVIKHDRNLANGFFLPLR